MEEMPKVAIMIQKVFRGFMVCGDGRWPAMIPSFEGLFS